MAQHGKIQVRDVQKSDLDTFFEHQLDPEANQMAGFTAKDPTDRDAFMAHWVKVLADEEIILKTICVDTEIAGYVLCHSWFGNPELSYWIDKEFWGQGVATTGVQLFLQAVARRPLFARVVFNNIGSMRVLEKCGFVRIGQDKGFANARGQEVEEVIFKLSSAA